MGVGGCVRKVTTGGIDPWIVALGPIVAQQRSCGAGGRFGGGRNGDVELGQPQLAGERVLETVEQRSGNSKRTWHHSARRSGMHPFGQHPNRERDLRHAAQRSGGPQPVVGRAPRIEADDQFNRTNRRSKYVDVFGQVGTSRLF